MVPGVLMSALRASLPWTAGGDERQRQRSNDSPSVLSLYLVVEMTRSRLLAKVRTAVTLPPFGQVGGRVAAHGGASISLTVPPSSAASP